MVQSDLVSSTISTAKYKKIVEVSEEVFHKAEENLVNN